MVKNWADHCSSDEEEVDLDEPVAVVDPDVLKKEIESENRAFHDGHDDDDEDEEEQAAAIEAAAAATATAAPAKKTYEFPADAPFTAYVGNLSYNITDPQELAAKLTTLAKDLLELDLKIVDSRIMMDRRNPSPKPRHRGFAYVQVETLDMLKKLMELNDKEATLEGRQLVLDTSTTNNNRRNSNRNNNNDANNNLPDGSQFRGGRFGNNNNNNRRPSSQQQRRSYTDNKKQDDGSGGVPAQRPSLKLAPRTKPIEESNSGSQSNIFGGAKARDEQAWQERRKSANEGGGSSSGGGSGDGGGRGGRGGGRGGRGGRGGGRHNNEGGGGRSQRGSFKDRKERKSFKDNKGGGGAAAAAAAAPPAEEQPAAPPPASPAKPAEKTAEKKVVNKFAALDFSDDSD